MPKSKEPLVSFILPVYNAEQFIEETLHSILEQTYKNFEVIAVDDGSKDGSLKILKHYASFDSRIKIISRENRGLVASLNEAIEASRGELLARIDSDDVCVPKRLEWQVEAMLKNKNAVLCYGFYEIFGEDGDFVARQLRPNHQADIKRMMYISNPIAHASVMLRKSLLPEQLYRSDVGPTEDYELWSRLAIHNDFVCVPRIVMRYRINRQSIMHIHGHLQWEHMARNTDNYWQVLGAPHVNSIKEIRANMRKYGEELARYYIEGAMLEMVLDNESQLAIKAIKRGYRKVGLKIFLNTALSSRTGFRVTRKRAILIMKNLIRVKLLKRTP